MNDFTTPEPEMMDEPVERPKRGRPRAADPVPAPPPVVPLVQVVIKRDFWKEDETGEIIRHRAGTIVQVPVDAAFEGIESGVLARVKK